LFATYLGTRLCIELSGIILESTFLTRITACQQGGFSHKHQIILENHLITYQIKPLNIFLATAVLCYCDRIIREVAFPIRPLHADCRTPTSLAWLLTIIDGNIEILFSRKNHLKYPNLITDDFVFVLQNQCCCRNCISWLVKQHFDKIINWRKRLEGSGQRVAQEIVAEVLLVSGTSYGCFTDL